jgi:hypothetical protein
VPIYPVPIYPIPIYSMPIYPVPIYPVPIYPVPIYPVPIYPVPIYPVPIYPVPIYPVPIYPVPIYPVPIYPVPIYPVPIYPVPIYPVPIYPVPIYPIDDGLINNKYQFKVGINQLRDGEKFADDERKTCDYPAFHFASRSWCAVNYSEKPLEAKIRIPDRAKINEPWSTDGKASADMIEIIQVFEVATGNDVTEKYR